MMKDTCEIFKRPVSVTEVALNSFSNGLQLNKCSTIWAKVSLKFLVDLHHQILPIVVYNNHIKEHVVVIYRRSRVLTIGKC